MNRNTLTILIDAEFARLADAIRSGAENNAQTHAIRLGIFARWLRERGL